MVVVCGLDRELCSELGACVSSVVPWFFYVFPPDFCHVCAYEGGYLFV